MKLDLDALKQIGQGMQKAYQVDSDPCEQLDKGSHVYRISFEPSTGRVEAHVQWPYFRNLVANEADHPATYTVHDGWLHLDCTTHGVEITTCLPKSEVINMLKEHLGSDYEVYEVHEDEDVLALFKLWQNLTGWDLDWEEQSYG